MTGQPPTKIPAPGAIPGPRPLPLHMAVDTLTWLSSIAALRTSNGALPPLRPEVAARAAQLKSALAGASPDAFIGAVERQARERLHLFADGVRRYRRAPRPARPAEPPAIWREGSTRLLDYGTTAPGAEQAPVVLVVPSLVNRYWVLDLDEERSLLRHLARQGLRPVVVDWGAPEADEGAFTLTDYIAGRLERALDFCRGLNGGPVAVVGYCMGGLLALALAQRRPADVRALCTMASPWDFHIAYGDLVRVMEVLLPLMEAVIGLFGVMPVDMLQAMFAGLDPFMTPDKFRRFALMDPLSDQARRFIQLEDWLNDGVPLAGPVARECFRDWHLHNTPPRGDWQVGGVAVDPARVPCPALVIVPEKDHIVPPESSRALGPALPRGEVMSVQAGHIGLVSAARAPGEVYRPLAEWISRQR